jgi:hypothetical protein
MNNYRTDPRDRELSDELDGPFDLVADILGQVEEDDHDQAWATLGLLRIASVAAYSAAEMSIRHGIAPGEAELFIRLVRDTVGDLSALLLLAEGNG